jgi:phage/plasmid primase-like uncharacterized protein
VIRDEDIHRFGEKNRCWYVAGSEYAVAGDWKEERQKVTWQANAIYRLPVEEKQKLQEKLRARRQEFDKEEAEKHAAAAKEAESIFATGSESGQSAYFTRKQVRAYGIRYGVDPAPHIMVPLRDIAGHFWSVQKIYDDGKVSAYC